jgi:hypothetical protein
VILLGSGNAGFFEGGGGYTDGTKRGVGDSLALGVGPGLVGELGFQGGDIVVVVHGGQFSGQVELFLGELQPFQRITGG